MSFQYGGTVNQNKEDNIIHQKNLSKLCRICCNIVGKKKYEVNKYTDSIRNHFYINISIDDNALHPEHMCQKCYLLMTSVKRKTTINLTPFTEWDQHSTHCQICSKVKLLQKGVIGTQNLALKQIPLGRTKANTNTWTQSALENLKEITQLDSLPKKLTLKDFFPDMNPHLYLCACGICKNLLRKPLIMKSCLHAFCFLCFSSFLKLEN